MIFHSHHQNAQHHLQQQWEKNSNLQSHFFSYSWFIVTVAQRAALRRYTDLLSRKRLCARSRALFPFRAIRTILRELFFPSSRHYRSLVFPVGYGCTRFFLRLSYTVWTYWRMADTRALGAFKLHFARWYAVVVVDLLLLNIGEVPFFCVAEIMSVSVSEVSVFAHFYRTCVLLNIGFYLIFISITRIQFS